ncbi:hypothetical protein [Deinococcus sp.]|uniref:hypothetical protein n=1 Tax=Deinococcus sp. TaxID=47478 RepID=UPI003B59117E
MSARSPLARLAALEVQAQQRSARIEAAKIQQTKAAIARLTPADLDTLRDG